MDAPMPRVRIREDPEAVLEAAGPSTKAKSTPARTGLALIREKNLRLSELNKGASPTDISPNAETATDGDIYTVSDGETTSDSDDCTDAEPCEIEDDYVTSKSSKIWEEQPSSSSSSAYQGVPKFNARAADLASKMQSPRVARFFPEMFTIGTPGTTPRGSASPWVTPLPSARDGMLSARLRPIDELASPKSAHAEKEASKTNSSGPRVPKLDFRAKIENWEQRGTPRTCIFSPLRKGRSLARGGIVEAGVDRFSASFSDAGVEYYPGTPKARCRDRRRSCPVSHVSAGDNIHARAGDHVSAGDNFHLSADDQFPVDDFDAENEDSDQDDFDVAGDHRGAAASMACASPPLSERGRAMLEAHLASPRTMMMPSHAEGDIYADFARLSPRCCTIYASEALGNDRCLRDMHSKVNALAMSRQVEGVDAQVFFIGTPRETTVVTPRSMIPVPTIRMAPIEEDQDDNNDGATSPAKLRFLPAPSTTADWCDDAVSFDPHLHLRQELHEAPEGELVHYYATEEQESSVVSQWDTFWIILLGGACCSGNMKIPVMKNAMLEQHIREQSRALQEMRARVKELETRNGELTTALETKDMIFRELDRTISCELDPELRR